MVARHFQGSTLQLHRNVQNLNVYRFVASGYPTNKHFPEIMLDDQQYSGIMLNPDLPKTNPHQPLHFGVEVR